MIPGRLIIKNFSCHERSEIDFTQFSAALIVGKNHGNEDIANGVGKTTIFKAIEYVLFNTSDESLEKIIRDDCDSCKVIFYFTVEDQVYRVARSRNKKGTSDLSLHKRTTIDADNSVVYVDVIDKDSTLWKDISSRRTGDTEKDLEKLIKINYKAFRNTAHFVQHDFTGIATLTPEKRKTLLKEVLGILVYSKLEKIAKDHSQEINKEIVKLKTLSDSLNDPEKEISEIDIQKIEYVKLIASETEKQEQLRELLETITLEVSEINKQLSSFDEKGASVKQREAIIQSEIRKITATHSEYSVKNNTVAKAAKVILVDIKAETERKEKLSVINFEELVDLEPQLIKIREETITEQLIVKNLSEELTELKIPLPDDSVCKHCRQALTEAHKKVCQSQIDKRIEDISALLTSYTSSIKERNNLHSQTAIKIAQLSSAKKELAASEIKIESLKKEYYDKSQLYNDYKKIIAEQTEVLALKQLELQKVIGEAENFNTDEVKKLRVALGERESTKSKINAQVGVLSKEITHHQSSLAVLNHKLQQSKDNLLKKADLSLKIKDAEERLSTYPSVIQAFSSTGIPNLIIQSVLDDWQEEANKLLAQMRPGLQLSFTVEKEKDDGETADTLDIEYFLHSKPREYGLLSGAQKVSVAFALKLGLAFLLQKMFGSDVRLLCLDEVDQSFDKAGVNAFIDIVKLFQKDFTILVITHNDRLKDKFAHAILVEQDQNMISNAKVVSSW